MNKPKTKPMTKKEFLKEREEYTDDNDKKISFKDIPKPAPEITKKIVDKATKDLKFEEIAKKEKPSEKDIQDILDYLAKANQKEISIKRLMELFDFLYLMSMEELQKPEVTNYVNNVWREIFYLLDLLGYSDEDQRFIANYFEWTYFKKYDATLTPPERKIN